MESSFSLMGSGEIAFSLRNVRAQTQSQVRHRSEELINLKDFKSLLYSSKCLMTMFSLEESLKYWNNCLHLSSSLRSSRWGSSPFLSVSKFSETTKTAFAFEVRPRKNGAWRVFAFPGGTAVRGNKVSILDIVSRVYALIVVSANGRWSNEF